MKSGRFLTTTRLIAYYVVQVWMMDCNRTVDWRLNRYGPFVLGPVDLNFFEFGHTPLHSRPLKDSGKRWRQRLEYSYISRRRILEALKSYFCALILKYWKHKHACTHTSLSFSLSHSPFFFTLPIFYQELRPQADENTEGGSRINSGECHFHIPEVCDLDGPSHAHNEPEHSQGSQPNLPAMISTYFYL